MALCKSGRAQGSSGRTKDGKDRWNTDLDVVERLLLGERGGDAVLAPLHLRAARLVGTQHVHRARLGQHRRPHVHLAAETGEWRRARAENIERASGRAGGV